ncbi:MAG: hypothetical protein ACR5LD_03925 [Symbiopectobacterium sp.]
MRGDPYFISHEKEIGESIERIGAYREAVGNDVDLCIEVHRRMKSHDAIVFAQGIAPYLPYFILKIRSGQITLIRWCMSQKNQRADCHRRASEQPARVCHAD